ncbi:hypothetical protein AMAG_18198 [Allomyces macrogynus ATCC 38327]|uniref:Uncharacterized protein n=1 Tax=Allomyces macrogynus (strain ATCC 38327) TaxID=578462 RepID=A0A0L0SAW7_ALLM3|nr:hypothetical protein AMAG_18198 [Allomyces macrogynus ATCC 38327]|eukprot:KNE59539.1 hypothetical protein AMAG_18198 [Allomyces macrogynus ATCC 38327]
MAWLLDEGISGIYRVGSPIKAGRRGIGARVPILFDQDLPVHSDVDRLCGHASDRVYRSGFFQATADCTLQPLYGAARTPDADDPPVKVRIPAAVAHALLAASARPVQPRSRHTYRDTDSMALSAHLYSVTYATRAALAG